MSKEYLGIRFIHSRVLISIGIEHREDVDDQFIEIFFHRRITGGIEQLE